jgi:predicted Zn-dependent protease
MKRRWKSLLLAINWLLLSLGTSLFIIVTAPSALTMAKEPTVETTKEITQETTKTPDKAPETVENKKPDSPQESTEGSNKKKPEDNQQSTDKKKPEEKPEPELTPEEKARQQKFIEADKLYKDGQIAAAEKIYKEVKEPLGKIAKTEEQLKPAITDPAQLSPAGKVYWRESEAGIAAGLQTKILVPLQLLVQQIPEFIPGHIRYSQALTKYGRSKEALDILDRAATLYPNQPDLVKVRVDSLAAAKKWMEASLAARQFAILNPKDPQAEEFTKLANDNLRRYKSYIQDEIRGNTIANVITGAIGYAVTGSLLGPFSALDSTLLLLKGEGAIGDSIAKQARDSKDLIKDEAVSGYLNEIGQKLAKIGGRDEFKYEFFVVPDDNLNAFALPGGKVFVHAGAIEKTKSEAELAGLLGHELSHVLLSHGFQIVTQGNLISNVTQYLPLGGTIGQIFTFSYGRDMERQADYLGTRLLTASGYAADGLRNLMKTLQKEQKNAPPVWFSSHPGGGERVEYLESLIASSGYNRYAYEGVERHLEMQKRVKKLLKDKKEELEKKRGDRESKTR